MATNVAVPGRMWSLGWVVIIRFILYLVIVAFLLQYMYFTSGGVFYRPDESIALLIAAFFVNLGILLTGINSRALDQLTALTYVVDIVAITWVVLSSGGFNSVLIPFYLPVLVMAAAWLPRRLTAVFPSIATLGVACIGFAHLSRLMDGKKFELFNHEILGSLRVLPYHTVVSTMLIFTVLFFVVSYLSGVLSDRIFVEQRLNAEILAGMNDGVAVIDRRGAALYVNGEFARLFPRAASRSDFDAVARAMFPAGDGVNLEMLWAMEATDGLRYHRELPAAADRPPLELKVSGLRVRGGVYGLLFVVTDLTLRKRMEKAERSLERSAAVSTMAAGLAHEIRNPLASLRSAIQEIGVAFPEGSQNRILANVVISESDRLDGIIGRFLDFSREGVLRIAQHRLGPMVQNTATMLRQGYDEANLRVEVTINDDPEVRCDGDRIMQVFVNLGLNARQAAPRHGGKVVITLGREERNGVPGVEIVFRDNGPGLSDDVVERIFEPFFSGRKGGTGMGLPLSRKEVLAHGGEIEGGNAGGGACFRVWLPLDANVLDSGGRRMSRVFRDSGLARDGE